MGRYYGAGILPTESVGRAKRERKKGWVTHCGDGSPSSCMPVQEGTRVQFRMLHRIAFGEGNTDWWWWARPGTLTRLAWPFGWVIMDGGRCAGVVGTALRVYYLRLTHFELNSFCRFASSFGEFCGYEIFRLHPPTDQ